MSKSSAASAVTSTEAYLKSLIKQSAFGFGYDEALETAMAILEKKDVSAILFTLACVNQIKRNVIAAFDAVEQIKRNYPKLAIERSERTGDNLNMGACRLVGYIFLHMVQNHSLARKMLAKSGSPIYGVPSNLNSEGARINKELNADIGTISRSPAANEGQVKLISIVLDSI